MLSRTVTAPDVDATPADGRSLPEVPVEGLEHSDHPEHETALSPPVDAAANGRGRPVPVRRRRRAPLQARSTRVVLGKVDPWSVLKVSFLFYISMCIVLLTASVLLWSAASSTGVIGRLETFMQEIGFTDFRFLPGQMLRGAGLAGAVLVVAGTFGNVLMAILYNLISDVMGGFKITLMEGDVRRRRI